MKPSRKDILTIPNLLSLLRLMMIPLFVWLYLHSHDHIGQKRDRLGILLPD